MSNYRTALVPRAPEPLDLPLRSLEPSYYTPHAAPEHAPQATLRDYLAVILKRKWLVAGIVLVGTTLAALYTFRTPPSYMATATLRVEAAQNDFLHGGEVTYAYRSPEDWNTQVKALTSPQLIRQVVLALGLQNDPNFLAEDKGRGFSATIGRAFDSARRAESPKPEGLPVVGAAEPSAGLAAAESLSPEQIQQLDPYVRFITRNLNVQQIPVTNLVSIDFRHGNPAYATSVANAVARIHAQNELRRDRAGTTAASTELARDIADLQTAILQQEQQRIDYLKSHDLPLGQAKGQNLTVERLATLSAQLLAAEDERKKLQAAYEQAAAAPDAWNTPEVYENKDLQATRRELKELERRRVAMLERYTTEWPGVKELDAQIRELRADCEAGKHEAVAVLASRYRAAVDREVKVKDSYAAERIAANGQNMAEVGLLSLGQQIETNKQLYTTLIQRQKEIEITSTGKRERVTVDSLSSVPVEPVPQGHAKLVGLAFLFSSGFGLGLAFLFDHLDDTLETVEDVDRHVRLPTLALVPPATRGSILPALRRSSRVSGVGGDALVLNAGSRSPLSESYSHLVASIVCGPSEYAPQVILVTSGQPGEGKTTTAANVAVMLAQGGAEVLLVDCDLRRPSIHKLFDMPNTFGLTNCLAGASREPDGTGARFDSPRYLQYTPGQMLDPSLAMDLLRECEGLPNLKVLPAGWPTAKPIDFLTSSEMQEFLCHVRGQFNYVIIDSPPVNAFADSAVLATHADGVVLVVYSEHSSRRMVQRVKRRLGEVGARVHGVVLNRSKYVENEYYSYYYSGYDDVEEQRAAS